MNKLSILIVSIAAVLFIAAMLINKFRKKGDKTRRKIVVENHKFINKPPTWRFQKFHPSRCPHNNGIRRLIVIDDSEKQVFVCADCVSIVEMEDLKQRDKFKA